MRVPEVRAGVVLERDHAVDGEGMVLGDIARELGVRASRRCRACRPSGFVIGVPVGSGRMGKLRYTSSGMSPMIGSGVWRNRACSVRLSRMIVSLC